MSCEITKKKKKSWKKNPDKEEEEILRLGSDNEEKKNELRLATCAGEAVSGAIQHRQDKAGASYQTLQWDYA